MRETLMAFVLLGAILVLGGCATSSNLAGKDGWKVYNGTRVDAALISEGWTPDADRAKSEKLEQPVLAWAACCGVVDLPLSFAADTVLLPITVPVTLSKLGDDSQTAQRP
jgi:uncharacterized protein YceK